MRGFILLLYLDHLLGEFVCTGSPGGDSGRELVSSRQRAAEVLVSACTAVAGWLPAELLLSHSPSVQKQPLRTGSLISDCTVYFAGVCPAHSDSILLHGTKYNKSVVNDDSSLD